MIQLCTVAKRVQHTNKNILITVTTQAFTVSSPATLLISQAPSLPFSTGCPLTFRPSPPTSSPASHSLITHYLHIPDVSDHWSCHVPHTFASQPLLSEPWDLNLLWRLHTTRLQIAELITLHHCLSYNEVSWSCGLHIIRVIGDSESHKTFH